MRIYFDENFSPALIDGLKRIQEGKRSDDITVCSIIEEFGRGAPDEAWIPGVATRHGIVVTQDLNINRTRAQWELCRSNKIGVVFIRPPKKGWSYWQIVQLIVKFWPQICELSRTTARPFGLCLDHDGTKIKTL
jgi:hypothetical protein